MGEGESGYGGTGEGCSLWGDGGAWCHFNTRLLCASTARELTAMATLIGGVVRVVCENVGESRPVWKLPINRRLVSAVLGSVLVYARWPAGTVREKEFESGETILQGRIAASQDLGIRRLKAKMGSSNEAYTGRSCRNRRIGTMKVPSHYGRGTNRRNCFPGPQGPVPRNEKRC